MQLQRTGNFQEFEAAPHPKLKKPKRVMVNNKLLAFYQSQGKQETCVCCGLTHSAWLGPACGFDRVCGFCDMEGGYSEMATKTAREMTPKQREALCL